MKHKSLLCLLLVILTNAGTMYATVVNGKCGSSLQWTLDTDTKILNISGSGAMYDYSYGNTPWEKYRNSISIVILPDGITYIGNYAFSYSSLVSITIPNTITSIGSWAFCYCLKLTSLIIPNSVTSIGNGAFSRVLNIKYDGSAAGSPWGARCVNGFVDGWLVYSDETKTYLVACSTAATGEITMPNTVISIGENAFWGGGGISSIIFSTSLVSIGRSGCSGACNLKQLDFPNSLISIGEYAFSQMDNLESISFGNSVESIGDAAFCDCPKLTSITLPGSVSSIGDGVFKECNGITNVFVDVNNQYYCDIDGVVYNKDMSAIILYPMGKTATEYTIPASVKSIANSAFKDCSALHTITFPNSVVSIGSWAFYGCDLTSLTLPSSIKEIKDWALGYSPNLKAITCKAITPPECGEYVFGEHSTPSTLYVPAGSLTVYQTLVLESDSWTWRCFSNVLPIEIEPGLHDYVINYLNKETELIYSEGVVLNLPAAPKIDGFTFIKWVVVAGDLEDGINIQATYTANIPASAPAEVVNPANPSQKLIRNGNVYILNGDKTYTLQGQEVK